MWDSRNQNDSFEKKKTETTHRSLEQILSPEMMDYEDMDQLENPNTISSSIACKRKKHRKKTASPVRSVKSRASTDRFGRHMLEGGFWSGDEFVIAHQSTIECWLDWLSDQAMWVEFASSQSSTDRCAAMADLCVTGVPTEVGGKFFHIHSESILIAC